MEYITAKEASEKWGVTESMVRVYCSQGRILNVCIEAQLRFEAQIALQGLLECQEHFKSMATRSPK